MLRGAGVDVVRLFSPEHGLRGRAAAGEKVGERRRPASGAAGGEPVRREDEAVGRATSPASTRWSFDLQDAGVRFYTYASTMLLCLEAAADAGIELVVLDRPEPAGRRARRRARGAAASTRCR